MSAAFGGGPFTNEANGIAVVNEGGVCLVTMWGEIDVSLRPALDEVLELVNDTSGPIELDLRDVTFMDSSGLAILLRVYLAGHDSDRPVGLRAISDAAHDVLAMVGMADRIPLVKATRGNR